MSKPRRPRFVQRVPDGPRSAFVEVEPEEGANYWLAQIRDAIVGDEPEFVYKTPKSGRKHTVQRLANAAAGELNEGTGLVLLTEYVGGVPVFVASYASNGRQVFCLRSTDAARAAPVDLEAADRWLAGRQATSNIDGA